MDLPGVPKKIIPAIQKYKEIFSVVEGDHGDFVKYLGDLVSFDPFIQTRIKTGTLIREVDRPARLYITLSNIPVLTDGVLQTPFLDLYSRNVLHWPIEDCIKWIQAEDAEINRHVFEMIDEREWTDTLDKFKKRSVAAATAAADPDAPRRGRPTGSTKKKKKPAPEPKKLDKKEAEKLLKETAESAKRAMDEAKAKKEATARERVVDQLRNAAVLILTADKGYSQEDSESFFDEKLVDRASGLADSVIGKKDTVESASKTLASYIKKNVKKKPPAPIPEAGKKAAAKEKHTAYSSVQQAVDLLTMACYWIMGRYNQSTNQAYDNCRKTASVINRLASGMYAGETTLADATVELENYIIDNVDLTVSETYRSGDEPVSQDTLLSTVQASKRQRIRARQDVAAAAQVRKFKQFGKFDPRGELRYLPQTETMELRVKEAPIKLVFQGERFPPGLTHEEKEELRAQFDQQYLEALREDFDIRIVRSPEGFVSLFDLKYLADGSILAEQDGKHFEPFNDLLEKLRNRFPEDKCYVAERYFFTQEDRERIR